MSYQSILVHVDDGERVVVRLGAAARLARSYDAELIGAYAVPTTAITPSVSAVLPDSVVEQRLARMGEAQDAAEALFRAAAARARVAAAEWRAPAGDAVDALVDHARCTDLVVIGQRDPDDDNSAFVESLANAVVLQSGRPVLVVPYTAAPGALGTSVLVAWNSTRESARAVADAMPLLARAEKVFVLSIDTDEEDDETPSHLNREQRLASWLRYHGIEAVPRHFEWRDVDVGELILSQSADVGADLIVMGAYSHSRLQEMVLGGVTRRVLEAMTVPVLMSH
ncbi:MAG TPA: universal stress protein [Casimicrobiaceae bacterium]|nr:universal stress protein [Casimicrobiaceae bacterium]